MHQVLLTCRNENNMEYYNMPCDEASAFDLYLYLLS